MTKRLQLPKPSVGYGYVGTWGDGKLGWFLPRHLCGGKCIDPPADEVSSWGDPGGNRVFLCQIWVQPLTDSKGRPITRIVRRKA